MRFKIDENLPVATARILSDAGHESKTVHDQRMAGAPDRRLAEVCREEDRALVTLDLDFSDIRASSSFGHTFKSDGPSWICFVPYCHGCTRKSSKDTCGLSSVPKKIRMRGGTSGGEKPR